MADPPKHPHASTDGVTVARRGSSAFGILWTRPYDLYGFYGLFVYLELLATRIIDRNTGSSCHQLELIRKALTHPLAEAKQVESPRLQAPSPSEDPVWVPCTRASPIYIIPSENPVVDAGNITEAGQILQAWLTRENHPTFHGPREKER
ncbi:hypothetical protein N7462_003285 [Penicillium macrosclerotiorum]|uniref:uncharacterized protein n=1 Tax=Penicillium macrosclerotiorum TaxID=303699 RepID=UPI002548247D|nr:uncharacterized protein N7462_003285 [Penicillium macrosclerotiorum]KAJ5688893.1 hypothetical protein N7462_003285 [Penicillium macrosclerotiorum]